MNETEYLVTLENLAHIENKDQQPPIIPQIIGSFGARAGDIDLESSEFVPAGYKIKEVRDGILYDLYTSMKEGESVLLATKKGGVISLSIGTDSSLTIILDGEKMSQNFSENYYDFIFRVSDELMPQKLVLIEKFIPSLGSYKIPEGYKVKELYEEWGLTEVFYGMQKDEVKVFLTVDGNILTMKKTQPDDKFYYYEFLYGGETKGNEFQDEAQKLMPENGVIEIEVE